MYKEAKAAFPQYFPAIKSGVSLKEPYSGCVCNILFEFPRDQKRGLIEGPPTRVGREARRRHFPAIKSRVSLKGMMLPW